MLSRTASVTRTLVPRFARALSSRSTIAHVPGDGHMRKVCVFPGEGAGPELCQAAMDVVNATGAPVEWEVIEDFSNPDGTVTERAKSAMERNKVALTGDYDVGIGRGTKPSVKIDLNRKLGLFANVVHATTMPNVKCRHRDVDIVVIRENTEGEYSGLEHEVGPGVMESLKVMTREGTLRIAKYAFEYAYLNYRRSVTAVHKANIMKQADGLFLESCREVAAMYPTVKYEEIIVDNCMMQLVSKPQQFDVMVTPNLYGSLVSNAVAGLTGSPGLAPGANIGYNAATFEQGVRHVGRDIAGLNVANPTGIILATSMMLHHLRLPAFADRVSSSLGAVVEDGSVRTRDVGGTASTTDVVKAVIARMR